MTYSARGNNITCKAIWWMAKVQAVWHLSESSFISNLITKSIKVSNNLTFKFHNLVM
jgi:hypothetical protein